MNNKVEDTINKGKTTHTIQNILGIDRAHIQQNLKKLLEPVVSDDTLLDVLTLPENIQKLNWRIEQNYTIKSKDDKELGTFNTIATKDPYRMIEELRAKVRTDMKVETEGSPEISEILKTIGFKPEQINLKENGNINRIELRLTYRKS